jgi:hypothetical protein
MASDEIRAFWNDGVRQERERVALRIAEGTKATSPAVRSLRRLNPGFYFNPLPDNSSGSKIRLFDTNKDESGRPNAMMKVFANQQHKLKGGVLTDYRYARGILDRRARDATNIQLESEGLPPNPEVMAELTAVESKQLELDILLQNIVAQIASGQASQLTLNDLRGLPRLLIQLVPTYSPADATQLLQFIGDDIIQPLRDEQDTDQRKVARRIDEFFEACKLFIEKMMPFLGLDENTKGRASKTLGRQIFGKRLASTDEETEEAPLPPQDIPPIEDEEDEEDEEEAEARPAPRPRPQVVPITVEEARDAFATNNIERLARFIREKLPRRTASKYFKSRTTMANLIRDELGVNIKI